MEPLSKAELVDVLGALEDAVAKNPAIARTPLFLGTMRLALSARAAEPRAAERPPEPVAAAPSLEVALLASARAQLQVEIAAKNEALAKLDVATRALAAERTKSQRSLTEAGQRYDALQADVERLTAAAAAQVPADALLAGQFDALFTIVRSYEWASKLKVAVKGVTREVPCCPVCTGLRPEGLPKGMAEAGHREACWYRYVIAKVYEQKP